MAELTILTGIFALLFTVKANELTNGDIQRNVNILKFEVNTLKETIAKKESSLRELRNCLRLSREMYNASSDFTATRPFIQLITQIKQYAQHEKYLYGSIRRRINGLYPPEILPNGPEQSFTMARSIADIFQDTSNFIRPKIQDYEPKCQCNARTFQDQRHWTLVQTSGDAIKDECNIKASLLLPDGNYVTWTYDRIMYCHANGTLLRNIRLPREPYIIAYFKDNNILVETFLDKAKIVQMVNLTSGKRIRPLVARFRGRFVSSGLAVYGSNIYVLDKSEFLTIIHSSRKSSNQIYKHHGRIHYQTIYPLAAEAGSPYGVLLGEFTSRRKVLIKGTGEVICSLDHPNLVGADQRGFVSSKGHVFLPDHAVNRVYVFDKDCIPTGDSMGLHDGQYIVAIRGINDTLFVQSNKEIYEYKFR